MDLSIIIVNYKTKNLVKECIKCIKFFNPQLNYEIIVVDNNSNDGIEEEINEKLKDVKCIVLPKNIGFAAGNNLGITFAKGRNVMILNPDIAIKKGELEKMVLYIDQHPEIGILAPKLINPDGSLQYSCFRYPKFLTPIYRRTFLGKTKKGKEIINKYLMKDWDHKNIQEVEWFLGACLLIPKKVLDKVGLFDERYFLYVEDTDLCKRFQKAGYKTVYFPEATLIHFHQRESAGGNLLKSFFHRPTREHIKSWFKYFKKWGFN